MDNFEKILFLDFTNKQFSKQPNSEYYATYQLLSENEKQELGELSRELHDIWTYVNSKPVQNVIYNSGVNSVQDYNNNLRKVHPKIILIAEEFSLTLRYEMSDRTKDAIIKLFGIDYFKNNFEK